MPYCNVLSFVPSEKRFNGFAKEAVTVVDGQRPESFHRREVSLRKRDCVSIVSVQFRRLLLSVSFNWYLWSPRCVLVHAPFGDGGAVEVVRSPLRGVRRCGPSVTDSSRRCSENKITDSTSLACRRRRMNRSSACLVSRVFGRRRRHTELDLSRRGPPHREAAALLS